MKLSNMPIGRKLALIFSVLLLPILLVCWLLVTEQRIAIDFAEKEQDGDRYLVTTRDLQIELLTQQRGLAAGSVALDPGRLSARLDAVKRIDQELGDAMKTADVMADLTKTMGVLASAAPGLKPTDSESAFAPPMTALRALIVRIGDNSNLILDPDLDSYYAMDILLGKMPDLVQRLAEVAQIARDVTSDGTIEADEKTRFLIAQGGLSATIEGLQSSIEQGFRGNADGSMKAALSARAEAAKGSLAGFVNMAVKGVTEQGGKMDAAQLEAVRRPAEADSIALWQATMAEMDRLLALRIAGFNNKLYLHLGLIAAGVLIAGAVALAIARSIRRPLVGIAETVDAMKAGDTAIVIAGQARKDEIGNIARALETFREAMLERAALQRHEAEEAADEIVRAANRDRHVQEFQGRIQEILAMLQKASGALSEQSDHLRLIVDHTNDRCLTVSASSEQTRETIQSAATATEELSASISEIARQIADSAAVAGAAMDKIKGSNAAVDSLNTAAQQIGDVVSLISDIAAQTNLLALNATIEAARAGEAGKGFAVVATEVKNLAAQTARATEQIAAHITDMQQASGIAAEAMRDVGSTVERMNEIATAISGAVEQQGAASREIASNVGQASAGASSVHVSIRDVAEIATEAATGAQQTRETASGLAHGVSDLEGAVARFLDGLNKEAS